MSRSLCRKLCVSASTFVLAVAQAAHAQSPIVTDDGEDELVDTMVITGTRLTTGFTAPTPVTVVGARQIEQRAPGSIFEIVRDIPSFRGTSGPSVNSTGAQNASKANLDLRGLGATRTLTLVNGRRHVPDAQAGTFDSNLIPTSLIERVDIVTGGASAAYGSDAVAGVVNFILKSRIDGIIGTAHYGESQRGDNAEYSISLAGGLTFANERGRVIAGGEITDNRGTPTMLGRKWGRLQPGVMSTGANRAPGLPAQIIANGVVTSAYNDGGLIPSGPLRGTAFADGGVVYQFEYGSVVGPTEMIGGGDYGSFENPDMRLRPGYERAAFLTRAEYDLTPDTVAFAQFHFGSLFTHGNSFGARIPNFNNYPVLIDNPFLPESVRQQMAALNLTSIPYSASRSIDVDSIMSGNRTNSYQWDAGVAGKVFGDWDWDIGVGHGWALFVPKLNNTPRTADFYHSAYVVTGPDGLPACGPVETNPHFNAQNPLERELWIANLSPGCVPYNIFGNNVEENRTANQYWNSASQQRNSFRQYTISANLVGDLFTLPAGPVSVAIGGEWRKDTADVVGCPDCQRGALMNQNYPTYTGEISVKEGYIEAGVPVVRDMPLAYRLDVNGAIRRTDYSTSGAVTTWKVGFTWDPVEMLRLRATRSRDIRAPSINELFNPGSEGNPNIVNRATGVSGFIKSNTVGNPNLSPEVADTSTIGLVFQPTWRWASGFRASVDLFDIKIRDVISTFPIQDVLDAFLLHGDQSFAPFIELDPANPVGVARVNSPQQNLNALKTNGIDFEIAYRAPIDRLGLPGSLEIGALGTHNINLRTVTRTSNTDVAGTAVHPKWVWNARFTYSLGRFTGALMGKYHSEVLYSATLIGPDDPAYDPALNNSINRNLWPSLVYWNANLQYDLIDDGGRRLQVFGVVDNIFDKDPPIVAISLNGGPYDLIGRAFKLGLRFTY